MCNLGYCYYTGIGVEENDEEAVKWFRKAAGRGFSRALFLLGECYEEGYGVQADLQKARGYYQQAADKGYKNAQDAIARLSGVPKPSSAYTYIPPAPDSPTPPAPPVPAPQPPKDKPKKGGLFGFFKK